MDNIKKRGLLFTFVVVFVILVLLTLPAKAISAITPVKQPPAADAGSPYPGVIGDPVNFDVSPDVAVASPLYGLDFSPQTGQVLTDVSDAQVSNLLGIVAPYTGWIRTYDTGYGWVIGPLAHSLGLKVAIGAWLGTIPTKNEAEIANLIALGQAGEADMLIVGSEVLLRGDLTESQLLGYINKVKQAVPGLPVTTADNYSTFLAHPAIIAAIDAILPNYYPFWATVNISSAISWIDKRYQQLISAAGGKPIIISETGWPSGGDSKGQAVPSPENAVKYLQDFISWARSNSVQYFYFQAFDGPWKAANEGSFAAHWGVWDKDGHLKPGMADVIK